MIRALGVMVVLSGCSSILGIEDFKVGDASIGTEMMEQGYCLGPMGWRVCLDAMPTDARTIGSDLNFDTTSSPLCATMQPANWMGQGHPAACFIIGSTVTFMASSVKASGSRPLVVFASDRIIVEMQLDVASHRTPSSRGPAAPSSLCVAPIMAGNSATAGGGGGAGGSFLGKGGDGANATGGIVGGRAAEADNAGPMVLRAGCSGANGGSGTEPGGVGGAGGGAVYLVAGNRITINGFINASGSSGLGGGRLGGGGGGGSGGMIHLNAPAIDGNGGVLVANGGGAGEGGDANLQGAVGNDPVPTMPSMIPLGGNTSNAGGAGGNGFPAAATMRNGTVPAAGGPAGGGGGGGGAQGFIRVNVMPSNQVTTSPPFTLIAQ